MQSVLSPKNLNTIPSHRLGMMQTISSINYGENSDNFTPMSVIPNKTPITTFPTKKVSLNADLDDIQISQRNQTKYSGQLSQLMPRPAFMSDKLRNHCKRALIPPNQEATILGSRQDSNLKDHLSDMFASEGHQISEIKAQGQSSEEKQCLPYEVVRQTERENSPAN